VPRRRSDVASSLALAAAAAQAAVLILRPRSGLVEPLPVRTGAYFTAEDVKRARAFRRPQLALSAAASAIEAGVLLSLVRRAPSLVRGRPLAGAAAAGALTSALLLAAPLPVAAAARRRSIRVGLTTDTWSHWAKDVAKSAGIGAAFAGGGSALAVGLMRRHDDEWWVPAALLTVLTGVGVLYAGPILLDPVFNTFTPVAEGELREEVLEVARGAGVEVDGVYVMDASRRTTASNAYVTGLGSTKRVVLYDTLLEDGDRDELRVVVAHELGHVRHRDTTRGLVFLALVAPAAMRAVARLTRGLSHARRPGPEVVPALALAVRIVGAPLAVIASQLSRRVEARTDAFSLRVTERPEAFISFQRGIALRNLADPDPPRWLRILAGTHPSTVQRIGIAAAYEQEQTKTRSPQWQPEQ
jgi:STE24 endopeptidase